MRMSSGAGFPIYDLVRRRLQTGLTIATLMLTVASTLFLLLFSGRLGVGISAATGTFTLGLSAIFNQFIFFSGALVFAVGAVLTSFIVFLMMAQRTRDFGLIKAAGCPNSLVAGYFMTELLTVTAVGCILGVVFGFLADFAAATVIFGGYSVPNWWFAPIVFVVFFLLAFFFGLQPLLKAAKMSAIDALSSVNYYGTTLEGKPKALSHSALTWRVASRSLIRRQTATWRIVLLLSIVFILLTVSVAGGTIAEDTTASWVGQGAGGDVVAVANTGMGNQYMQLLEAFSGAKANNNFNYTDPRLAVPSDVVTRLEQLPTVTSTDPRLVLYGNIHEISNFTVIDGAETNVGDSRNTDALVIGLDPKETSGMAMKGSDLSANATSEAIISDSIVQTMYSPNPRKGIALSDPLVEGLQFQNATFRIVGVSVDPINNGFVVYVPIDKLMNTAKSEPNIVLIQLNGSIDRESAIDDIRATVKQVYPDLDVFDVGARVAQNTAFLESTWQTIMVLPLLTLASAAISLVGYMMLSVEEQRQEFAMLRAVGAKPRLIIGISAIQSAIVLFSAFGVGLSLGVTGTLLILMAHPLVTGVTIASIAAWLLSALAAMYLLSLYPVFKLSKTPILKIMA
jgi:ABC-type antimicrobial peptide transport system permease subunit